VRKFHGDQKGLSFADDMYSALDGADALIIATEWAEFSSPDFAKVKQLLKQPVIFDGRNIYDMDAMKQTGFYYQSVGRETING
jgi:UDPglucose 6-dehydrogenase